METIVQLVATANAIRSLLPEQFNTRYACDVELMGADWLPNGPVSANFQIEPARCQTKLGRWLAETVSTTRFDDDHHRLSLTVSSREEEIETKAAFERFTRFRISNLADFERLQTTVHGWLSERKGIVNAFGNRCFSARSFDFLWPVFGSAPVKCAQAPEEYFDMCAGLIRSHNPVRVVHIATMKEPPTSCQVTRV